MEPKSGRRYIAYVFVWFFISWMNWRAVVTQLVVEEGPRDAHVRIGQEVTFVCDLRSTVGYTVYWFHQQRNLDLTIGRQVNVGLTQVIRDRVSVVGEVSQEEFNLRIVNVQVTDDGHYYCQYAYSGGKRNNAGEAELTVLIPPSSESPFCEVDLISGTSEVFDVGDAVSFYCYQRNGNPPPDLMLVIGSNYLAGPGRTITHRYLLTGDDNGVVFTCVMTTPALDEPRNCSVMPLRILPNATISPTVSRVEEWDQVSFTCYGDGEPRIANYRWRVASAVTGEILPTSGYSLSENGQILEIASVVEDLELLCIVSVPSGLSGNSTARVGVVKRDVTSVFMGSTVQISPTNESSTSAGVTVVAVVLPMVIVIVVTVLIVLFLRRRKRTRKPNVSIRYTSSVRHHAREPDDGVTPGKNGQTTGMAGDETGARSELDTTSNLYAFPGNHHPDPPVTQSHHRSSPKLNAVHSADRPVDPAPVIAVYAKPDKKSRSLQENEYSTVPVEEPKEADSGLVYADLDLNSSSASKDLDKTGLPSSSEQTVYATIRS